MMVLYRHDLVGGDLDATLQSFESEYGAPLASYGAELLRGVFARQAEIDDAIAARLEGWTLDRLGTVERAVLRIAMFELIERRVPGPIVIDEAVELAKRYATPEAGRLVNGALGSWLREHRSAVDERAPEGESASGSDAEEE